MKTYVPKQGDLTPKWYVLNAEGRVLGRVAAEAAKLLRGKHKPEYTPYLDCGDHVIIVNAEKAVVTGRKGDQKCYYRHSGYPGGLKKTTYKELIAKHPARAMVFAVRGMLPQNRLGRKLLKHLRVYVGPNHRHQAQQPEICTLE